MRMPLILRHRTRSPGCCPIKIKHIGPKEAPSRPVRALSYARRCLYPRACSLFSASWSPLRSCSYPHSSPCGAKSFTTLRSHAEKAEVREMLEHVAEVGGHCHIYSLKIEHALQLIDVREHEIRQDRRARTVADDLDCQIIACLVAHHRFPGPFIYPRYRVGARADRFDGPLVGPSAAYHHYRRGFGHVHVAHDL